MELLDLLGANEWTVECNPATVSAEKARLLREYGVNRISMGVQSLDEGLLDRLGRTPPALPPMPPAAPPSPPSAPAPPSLPPAPPASPPVPFDDALPAPLAWFRPQDIRYDAADRRHTLAHSAHHRCLR